MESNTINDKEDRIGILYTGDGYDNMSSYLSGIEAHHLDIDLGSDIDVDIGSVVYHSRGIRHSFRGTSYTDSIEDPLSYLLITVAMASYRLNYICNVNYFEGDEKKIEENQGNQEDAGTASVGLALNEYFHSVLNEYEKSSWYNSILTGITELLWCIREEPFVRKVWGEFTQTELKNSINPEVLRTIEKYFARAATIEGISKDPYVSLDYKEPWMAFFKVFGLYMVDKELTQLPMYLQPNINLLRDMFNQAVVDDKHIQYLNFDLNVVWRRKFMFI